MTSRARGLSLPTNEAPARPCRWTARPRRRTTRFSMDQILRPYVLAAPLVAIGVALASCASTPRTLPGADLALLPADPGAWRVVVGHWEAEAELSGDHVEVPPPSAEYARSSRLSASAR